MIFEKKEGKYFSSPWMIQYAEKNYYVNFTRINFNKLPNCLDNLWCIRIVNITEDGWEVYGPRVEKIMETRKHGAMATDVSNKVQKVAKWKGFSTTFLKFVWEIYIHVKCLVELYIYIMLLGCFMPSSISIVNISSFADYI